MTRTDYTLKPERNAVMSESTSPLENRIDSAIQDNPQLTGKICHIEMRPGRILLRGVVRSYYQKQVAQEVVRQVDGVERIENQLEVSLTG
jgi:osmotically-inducible protein OsmY